MDFQTLGKQNISGLLRDLIVRYDLSDIFKPVIHNKRSASDLRAVHQHEGIVCQCCRNAGQMGRLHIRSREPFIHRESIHTQKCFLEVELPQEGFAQGPSAALSLRIVGTSSHDCSTMRCQYLQMGKELVTTVRPVRSPCLILSTRN